MLPWRPGLGLNPQSEPYTHYAHRAPRFKSKTCTLNPAADAFTFGPHTLKSQYAVALLSTCTQTLIFEIFGQMPLFPAYPRPSISLRLPGRGLGSSRSKHLVSDSNPLVASNPPRQLLPPPLPPPLQTQHGSHYQCRSGSRK